MPKLKERDVCLVDEEGKEWVRASLTPPKIKRIIREYLRYEIRLEEESK
jgi:hypothetical protein